MVGWLVGMGVAQVGWWGCGGGVVSEWVSGLCLEVNGTTPQRLVAVDRPTRAHKH